MNPQRLIQRFPGPSGRFLPARSLLRVAVTATGMGFACMAGVARPSSGRREKTVGMKRHPAVSLGLAVALALCVATTEEAAAEGKTNDPPATAEAAKPETPQEAAAEKPKEAKPAVKSTGYYVESGSYGTKRETPVPGYVRQADKTGIDAFSELDWLDLGLDYRVRYEMRDDDYRKNVARTDNLFLLRTRAYFGIKNIIDPLRLVVEVEDARSGNGRFPKDNRDWNEAEPIQLIAELYFKDALGKDDLGQNRPISLRAGRMWFEKLDRRLIGNNAWRNTTNTFQGVHLDLGQEANDWELELIAAQPLDRKLHEFDRTNEEQWFVAAIGHWRRWSKVVTLEPYYLLLSQGAAGARAKREIHSPALRFYGPIGQTAFHYDVNFVYQTGEDAGRDHEAFGLASELGYKFNHAWKPRLSVFYGMATGDKNPTDNDNERFERFYGFARPWSANDYFIWENFHSPKLRLEFVPLKDLRVDAGYSAYWLFSDTDRWSNANLRDTTGQSGDFMGHEFDIRARYPLTSRIEGTLGYAHFEPGGWTKNVGRDNPSDFVYLELAFNVFGKP